MARRYRSRRYSRSHRSSGYERALQHIEDAERLSAELGGTDKDVKSYFFSLPPQQLAAILDEYQKHYGIKAREYAEQTIPKWRTGKVKMAGQTAERLFKLLPPRMPLQAKYKLTEGLWKHFGPSSRKRLRIGLDARLEDVLEKVSSHIEQVVIHYKIPENIEKRFNWLSAGDVTVKQDLLNYVRSLEKRLVVEGAKGQLPVLLNHLAGSQGRNTQRVAQILKIGNHELELLLDKNSSGVILEDPTPTVISSTQEPSVNWGCVIIVIAIIGFFILASSQ